MFIESFNYKQLLVAACHSLAFISDIGPQRSMAS
jgi:hypothetical protein